MTLTNQKKENKHKHTLKIVLVSVVVIILLVLVAGYFKLYKSPVTVAYLHLERGDVTVNTGNGWQSAQQDMNLGLEDKVKTGANGKASIILYESVFVSLEPNTEVSIADLNKEHLLIKQETGETWNKFTTMMGVNGMSVQTPTSIASVRGTSFGVTVNQVIVGEGSVEVTRGAEKIVLKQEEKVDLRAEKLERTVVDETDRTRVVERMSESLNRMKESRSKELAKNQYLIDKMERKYGFSMERELTNVDSGSKDLDVIEENIPVQTESIKKIRLTTEEIIKEQTRINSLTKR
ncbi:hypothetical protein HN587_03385 [Candidatus Woesearchaeota archaeon]|jgi:hypothetical protein|nr:hypothetical protein [Candidatus Woesearchaeota archaeon]